MSELPCNVFRCHCGSPASAEFGCKSCEDRIDPEGILDVLKQGNNAFMSLPLDLRKKLIELSGRAS